MIFGIIVNTKIRDCCFGWTCRDKACLLSLGVVQIFLAVKHHINFPIDKDGE